MKTPPLRIEYWFYELTKDDFMSPEVFEAYKKAKRTWGIKHKTNKGPFYDIVISDFGPKTKEELKALISPNQQHKFNQGERHFVVTQSREAQRQYIRQRFMPKKKRESSSAG